MYSRVFWSLKLALTAAFSGRDVDPELGGYEGQRDASRVPADWPRPFVGGCRISDGVLRVFEDVLEGSRAALWTLPKTLSTFPNGLQRVHPPDS